MHQPLGLFVVASAPMRTRTAKISKTVCPRRCAESDDPEKPPQGASSSPTNFFAAYKPTELWDVLRLHEGLQQGADDSTPPQDVTQQQPNGFLALHEKLVRELEKPLDESSNGEERP